jgi:hypothetical protein
VEVKRLNCSGSDETQSVLTTLCLFALQAMVAEAAVATVVAVVSIGISEMRG